MVNLKNIELKCFGSEYGHWCFIHHDGLKNSTIISGGVGEDISFDVDFASEYNSTIIFYDPTPRSIEHFERVKKNFGKGSKINYVSGGNQPIESYDLSNLSESNFVYNPYALWKEKTKVKFFAPTNPNHVSHSILNYQRNYDMLDSNFIEVECLKLSDEIKKLDKLPEIIKLDIESAVLEVIEDLFSEKIFANQMCVEYDEQHNLNNISIERINKMNKIFDDNGYICVHQSLSNYLFVNKLFLNSVLK